MWLLLTQNVSVLPTLRLDQWQGLFDILAGTANGYVFAAIKTFEVYFRIDFSNTLVYGLAYPRA